MRPCPRGLRSGPGRRPSARHPATQWTFAPHRRGPPLFECQRGGQRTGERATVTFLSRATEGPMSLGGVKLTARRSGLQCLAVVVAPPLTSALTPLALVQSGEGRDVMTWPLGAVMVSS